MKTWEVTTRGADGKPEIITVSAETRQEVFAELAKMGKNAIRVEEATGEKSRKVKSGGAPSKGRGLIAAAIVVLGVGAAVWYAFFFKPTPEMEKSARDRRGAEIVEVPHHVSTNKVVEKKPLPPKKAGRKEPPQITAEQRLQALEEKAIKTPIDLTPVSNRVFKTGIEQQIALIFTTPLGNPPPFLTRMTLHEEAHLTEILMNRVDPKETDPEKIREAKEVVSLAKAELKEYIKEGGDIQTFLEYYHGKLQQAFKERSAVQSSVMKVIKEEPEIAADYIREVNKRLDEKGIRRVTISPIVAQRIGYVEEN